MFNGMSMGMSGGVQAGGAPVYTSQNTMGMQAMGPQQGMVPYGQTGVGNGMMNQPYNNNNPAMMQMTPYGMQQQAPLSGGGYGQGGNVGLAGPGQMLQIQAAGFDPYAQQQQQSGDKFSAFDGL
jgi:hypothetical protein